ncbi:MAG: NifU family protein [Bacteroidetes bacterium]|nr:NifU family protein [Bacteroidota bacterium]
MTTETSNSFVTIYTEATPNPETMKFVANKMILALDSADFPTKDSEPVKKIKELLDNHVKPAVEMDGGMISFKSFENGIVTVVMKGSCSGCPSSTITLKSGIENLLKRMVPEVIEVVAEAA